MQARHLQHIGLQILKDEVLITLETKFLVLNMIHKKNIELQKLNKLMFLASRRPDPPYSGGHISEPLKS